MTETAVPEVSVLVICREPHGGEVPFFLAEVHAIDGIYELRGCPMDLCRCFIRDPKITIPPGAHTHMVPADLILHVRDQEMVHVEFRVRPYRKEALRVCVPASLVTHLPEGRT